MYKVTIKQKLRCTAIAGLTGKQCHNMHLKDSPYCKMHDDRYIEERKAIASLAGSAKTSLFKKLQGITIDSSLDLIKATKSMLETSLRKGPRSLPEVKAITELAKLYMVLEDHALVPSTIASLRKMETRLREGEEKRNHKPSAHDL